MSENRSSETMGLLDTRVAKRMNVFRVALVVAAEKTPLPEILEVFGNDLTVKFLDVFAGTTIKVPSRDIITNAARDADIYVTIMAAQGARDAYTRLAERYQLKPEQVKKIFTDLNKLLNENYKVLIK